MIGIETLPNGQRVVAGDTHLAVWSRSHGNIITDPHLFKWLKPRLEGVKVVYDVGAAIGDHTRQYLDWGMDVVAFEPNPLAFACLTHNCPEARCLKVAASDTAGVATFAVAENVGASRIVEGGDLQVLTVALDSLILPAPDFIKIDIEGHEVFALQGMKETLRAHKPIVFVEVNKGALATNGHTIANIAAVMLGAGYTQFESYPPDAKEEWEQYDLLCRP